MVYFEARKVRSYLQLIIAPLMLGGLLFLSNCNPADRYQYHYPISQETKDYCYFKQGSWWVYVDSNKMAYDTVICMKSVISVLDDPIHTSFSLRTMLCEFESSFYKVRMEYQNLSTGLSDTLQYQQILDYAIAPNYSYFIPFFISDSLKELSYDNKLVAQSKVQMLGFENVLSFETTGIVRANLPKVISWAPHIGIVYKAMPDGTHWELIDYEVLQS